MNTGKILNPRFKPLLIYSTVERHLKLWKLGRSFKIAYAKQLARQGTEATTFAFSSVFILLVCDRMQHDLFQFDISVRHTSQ